MSKLHLFDMDGTLLRGSACLDISRHMGQLDAVNEIEARWTVGGVGHVEFYELCLPLWTGITDADVTEIFTSSQWLDGVQEVWADITRRGEHSAVITLSPQFFAEGLIEWGAESVHGAAVSASQPLDPTRVMTPELKVDVAESLIERYGLDEADCVAYGDSSSDVPLFQRLPYTVAVNGSESLRAIAAASYDGGDLRGAYHAARELLDGPPTDGRSA